jgi:flagellin-specific chaperone FliS
MNCNENKKVFVFAVSNSENEEMHVGIKQDEIKEKLESIGKKYEMKLILSEEKAEDISEYFVKILEYSYSHLRKKNENVHNQNEDELKNGGESGSCIII